MLATQEIAALDAYYRTVAPFYPAEMRLRDDLIEWRALANRLAPRRILELGCGSGRVARALAADDHARAVTGVDISTALFDGEPAPFRFLQADMRELPLDEEFDLIVAADDPFAHLLTDEDRTRALREARRLLSSQGLLVIDGLYLPLQDDALAGTDGLVRERHLDDGTLVHEEWRRAGDHLYDTRYTYARDGAPTTEARARVRAWHCGEEALRANGARVAGALDERDFDPWGDRLVAVVAGWS